MYHYKDREPSETIEYFKRILSDLGLSFRENVFSPIEGIWSCTLLCNEISGISSNGKGLTKDLCLASAYGEFIELLENFPNMVSDDYDKSSDFKLFPDEHIKDNLNLFDLNVYVASDFAYLNSLSPMRKSDVDRNKLNKCVMVPFDNVTKNRKEYLPYHIIRQMNHTNGAASGNTYEEACVESLSEILERYTFRKIIEDRLTPPEIDRKFISDNYSKLYDIIEKSERELGVDIKVYDFSLGLDFPVLCVVSYDKKTHTYKSRTGSHPLFEIALERCLTEYYQCFCKKSYELTQISIEDYDDSQMDSLYQYSLTFLYGTQIFPVEFFKEEKSWSPMTWLDKESFDNKIGFEFLKSVIERTGKPIYIRDNSWLDVPAVYIYIPDMSLCKIFMNNDFTALYLKFLKLMDKCDTLEKDRSESDIDFVTDYYLNGYSNIMIVKTFTSVEETLVALNLSVGKVDKAISVLKSKTPIKDNYKCLMTYLKLLKSSLSEKDINETLKLFYDNESVDYVMMFEDKGHIIEKLSDYYSEEFDKMSEISRFRKNPLNKSKALSEHNLSEKIKNYMKVAGKYV